MKILLMTLALATASFSVLAQTPSDQGGGNTDVETMRAQEGAYQGAGDDMTTTPQAEESLEDVSDPGLQGTEDDTMIQEEEESMRSDTIEGSSEGLEGSESTTPGTTTP